MNKNVYVLQTDKPPRCTNEKGFEFRVGMLPNAVDIDFAAFWESEIYCNEQTALQKALELAAYYSCNVFSICYQESFYKLGAKQNVSG